MILKQNYERKIEMKSSHPLKALIAIAVTIPALAGASATMSVADDPTQGRIQSRQTQNVAQYHKCAKFALRVFQGGLSQAGNNSAKIRAARTHYQSNLGRCRARFL